MTFYDWLVSPSGVELTHAIILLVTAVAAYVSFLAHRQSSQNAEMLNSHLEKHIADATASRSDDPDHNI